MAYSLPSLRINNAASWALNYTHTHTLMWLAHAATHELRSTISISDLFVASFLCDGPVLGSNFGVFHGDAGDVIVFTTDVEEKALFLHAVVTGKLLSHQLEREINMRMFSIHR